MDQGNRKLATALLAAAAITTSAASLKAVVYAEPGDAGQTLATAANTNLTAGGSGTLTGISGTIGTSGDADLYVFTLAAGSTVTITANGGTSSTGNYPIDTSLFLFDSTGKAVIANDDQSGTSYQGQLTLSGLAGGTYYLGISLSGNEAINSASQLLFTQNGTTQGVRGPAAGVNPATLGTFNGNTSFAETGSYNIGFVAVPEPSTYATLALGAVASLAFFRRRSQAAA